MYKYKYPRAAITVDALVYTEEEGAASVLLVRRGSQPFKGSWALPGGFLNIDERLETACKRELQEETGLEVEHMIPFRAFDAVHRDPRQRTVTFVFSAKLPEKAEVKGADDADSAAWFPLNDLPELAFDHLEIVKDFFEM
jgi:8-oxo-dGTP diphosphatase